MFNFLNRFKVRHVLFTGPYYWYKKHRCGFLLDRMDKFDPCSQCGELDSTGETWSEASIREVVYCHDFLGFPYRFERVKEEAVQPVKPTNVIQLNKESA